MRLLIHHHTVAYVEGESIWVQSFIGAWAKELSNYFSEIGLLLHISKEKRPQQDYEISDTNIKIESLGINDVKNRIRRNRYVRSKCKTISSQYDYLLIRGVTPRQLLIFNNCNVKSKYYLLVGSLVESKPEFRFTINDFVAYLFYKYRMRQLKIIFRNSNVLSNSPQIVTELSKVMNIKSTFVPTNTISLKEFEPREYRCIISQPKLLFCGRVAKEKGIEELIKAVSILKHDGVKTSLTVVGETNPKYKHKLTQLCKEKNVNSEVIFKGYVKYGKDLMNYYKESDIYILPSWHEGFPHTIWEAAANCTPIIVTRVGGINGLITEDDVYFIRSKCPEDISDGVKSLMLNQSRTKARTISIYKKAQSYAVENCAKKIFQVINTQ